MIVVVILIGGAVGLLYLSPLNSNHITTASSTTMLSSTTSASSISPTTTIASTMTTTTTTARTTKTTTTTTTSSTTHYSLNLVQRGVNPILASSLTSTAPVTYFRGDGLGGDCGGSPCFTYNYNDNNNSWQMQGDFEPGASYLYANRSGITLMDQTCITPYQGQPLKDCGPYWEWNGDKRFVGDHLTGEENSSELSGALYGVPTTGQVFSIYLNLPQYNFNGCSFNDSSYGCSYEGYTPEISGVWALDVGKSGTSDSSSVAVSLSESCSALTSYGTCDSRTNLLSVGISTAAFVNGGYDQSLSKGLPAVVPFFPYSPNHKLTIATDLKTYFEIWVDNALEYYNSTIPIPSGNNYALNFYQFDNVDNMTLGTTWSNMTVYSTPFAFVSGLSSGMSVYASGSGGFNDTVASNSSGIAMIDIATNPTDLFVTVLSNGVPIANYSSPLAVGAELRLTT